jgi:acetyl esterase/lipase
VNISRRNVVSSSAAILAATGLQQQEAQAVSNTTSDDPTTLPIPAHTIPIPDTISPEAKAFLTAAAKRIRAQLAGNNPQSPSDPAAVAKYLQSMASGFKGTATTIPLSGGAQIYRLTPDGRTGRLAKVAYMDIHGGGFVQGGGETCKYTGMARAADYGIEVFSIDYRLLPDHPYPAGLDDCVAAYKHVLREFHPSDIVVGGASAGGNLAAALMLRARAEGLPFPAGLLLLTPVVDMTGAGDSRQTNRYLDVVIGNGYQQAKSDPATDYGSNASKSDPFVSPIFGDASNWPPTFLSTGTRDLLLSDTVRMHRHLRRAGVNADLIVAEAGSHGGFMGLAPEDREVIADMRKFAMNAWGIKG